MMINTNRLASRSLACAVLFAAGAWHTTAIAVCVAGPALTATPIVFNGTVPASAGGATFLDTFNFCIADPDSLFNMTSTFTPNILGGGAAIFENQNDAQVPGGANAPSFTNFPLTPIDAGYHIHPQGFIQGGTGGGTYSITLWASAPAILVAPVSGLETTEAGSTAQFSVSLNTPANATLDVPVSSSDTGEATVSPAIVSITAGETGPKTVTVTGVADGSVDGNQPYTIILGPAAATDPRFANQDPPDVTATNVDLDGKIIVSALSGQMTEAGGQATFTVRLVSAPAADVTIPVSVNKPTEALLSATSLVLTTANGTTPQTVTLTGVDDAVTDGDQTVIVSLGPAMSADTGFAAASASVSASNVDDDIPAIVVTTTTALVTHEDGDTATFTVRLSTTPAADVCVPLFVSDATEAIVSPAELVFTAANATQPQIVTLTGLADGIVDGNAAYQVLFAPAVSADLAYQGLVPVANLNAINEDEDTAPVPQPQNSFGGCSLSVADELPTIGFEWLLMVVFLAGLRVRHHVAFQRKLLRGRLSPRI